MFIAFFYFICVSMMLFNVCVNDTVPLFYISFNFVMEVYF